MVKGGMRRPPRQAAATQPTGLVELPMELWRHVLEMDGAAARAARPVSRAFEQIAPVMVRITDEACECYGGQIFRDCFPAGAKQLDGINLALREGRFASLRAFRVERYMRAGTRTMTTVAALAKNLRELTFEGDHHIDELT